MYTKENVLCNFSEIVLVTNVFNVFTLCVWVLYLSIHFSYTQQGHYKVIAELI